MRRALLLASVLATLTCAVPADAKIVIQRGMAGVRIGMTVKQVKARLGEPIRTVKGRNDFGPYSELRYPNKLTFSLQGRRRVTSITTTGKAERTAGGLGVGTSERTLKAKVVRVKCEKIVDTRTCHVGEFVPGRRITDFVIRDGKVTRVTIGNVID